MFRALALCSVVVAVLAATGCGSPAAAHKQPINTTFALAEEPSDPIEVLDIKDQAKDGETVAVVGRLGGGIKPWIEGRAAFLIVDTRVLPTCHDGEKCDENCPGCAEAMLAASTMVKFLGEDGKVLPIDARELLGVQEQQTVVIRGVANRDKTGNLTIAAQKIFVRR